MRDKGENNSREAENTLPKQQPRAKRVRIVEAMPVSFGEVTAGIKMAVISERHPI